MGATNIWGDLSAALTLEFLNSIIASRETSHHFPLIWIQMLFFAGIEQNRHNKIHFYQVKGYQKMSIAQFGYFFWRRLNLQGCVKLQLLLKNMVRMNLIYYSQLIIAETVHKFRLIFFYLFQLLCKSFILFSECHPVYIGHDLSCLFSSGFRFVVIQDCHCFCFQLSLPLAAEDGDGALLQ